MSTLLRKIGTPAGIPLKFIFVNNYFFALPFAMQLAIVIDNVTLALLEVIQFGVARAAISGLAMCLQVVTINANAVA